MDHAAIQQLRQSAVIMEGDTLSAEEKIIQATIECIEEEGLEGTTTRKIAERAGVNNASLNYYFRTKDNLIRRAIDTTLKNAFDWDDFRESEQASAPERLSQILEDLAQGAITYPGLSRAQLTGVLQGDYEGPLTTALTRFLTELEEDLAGRQAEPDRENLRLAVVAAVAAVLLPAIFAPRLFVGYAGVNLCDPADRRRYVSHLSRVLLSVGGKRIGPTQEGPK